jgi:hypothetical protein
MQRRDIQWSPQVGDTVRVKESNVLGTVVKTKGAHELRLRLQVDPMVTEGDVAAVRHARAATRIASRWYGLDELEPLS